MSRRATGTLTPLELRLLEALIAHPRLGVRRLHQEAGSSYDGARVALARLEELGLVAHRREVPLTRCGYEITDAGRILARAPVVLQGRRLLRLLLSPLPDRTEEATRLIRAALGDGR